MSLHETIDRLIHYAAVFAWSTHVLARLAIESPELEAKIMFGRHVHLDALLADELRKRLAELSVDVDLRHLRSRAEPFAWAPRVGSSTASRVNLLYKVSKQSVLTSVATHRGTTSVIIDEPTARLLDTISSNLSVQTNEAATLFDKTIFGVTTDIAQDQTAQTEWPASTDWLASPYVPPESPARDARCRASGEPPDPFDPRLSPQDATIALLHQNLTDLEIPSIESCCLMILEFPEMPWDFVLDMARQCWDESRHALAFLNRIEELGAALGRYATSDTMWLMATKQPLPIRLALHQCIGEWTGVDGALWNAKALGERGDLLSAQIFDFVARDEITHVAFGNKWLLHVTGVSEGVARANVEALNRRAAFGKSVDGRLQFPFNRWACARAGFSRKKQDEFQRRWILFGSRFS